MVSNIRHLKLHNPLLEAKRNGLVVEMVMTQSAATGEDAGARFETLVGWRLRANKLNRKSPASPPIAAPPFPFV
jgi:hypothetical protein